LKLASDTTDTWVRGDQYNGDYCESSILCHRAAERFAPICESPIKDRGARCNLCREADCQHSQEVAVKQIRGNRGVAGMDDVISKLTAEQAARIVERLGRKGGEIGEAVVTEAMNVLTEIELNEIADDVFDALDSIDLQECWDRSGSTRDGYVSPDEAADEIIDEELHPFFEQIERYHELGMPDQEATYCMGVLSGIYRYERDSQSEFKAWCVDIPNERARLLLDKWQKRNIATAAINTVHKFIRESCPEWTKWLKDQKR
jgi:hypothetical protein